MGGAAFCELCGAHHDGLTTCCPVELRDPACPTCYRYHETPEQCQGEPAIGGVYDDPHPDAEVSGAVALASAWIAGAFRHGRDPISEPMQALVMVAPVKPYAHQLVQAAAVLLRRAADVQYVQVPYRTDQLGAILGQLDDLGSRPRILAALRGVHLVATGRAPSSPRIGAVEMTTAHHRVNAAIDRRWCRMVSGRFRCQAELTEAGRAIAQRAGWDAER